MKLYFRLYDTHVQGLPLRFIHVDGTPPTVLEAHLETPVDRHSWPGASASTTHEPIAGEPSSNGSAHCGKGTVAEDPSVPPPTLASATSPADTQSAPNKIPPLSIEQSATSLHQTVDNLWSATNAPSTPAAQEHTSRHASSLQPHSHSSSRLPVLQHGSSEQPESHLSSSLPTMPPTPMMFRHTFTLTLFTPSGARTSSKCLRSKSPTHQVPGGHPLPPLMLENITEEADDVVEAMEQLPGQTGSGSNTPSTLGTTISWLDAHGCSMHPSEFTAMSDEGESLPALVLEVALPAIIPLAPILIPTPVINPEAAIVALIAPAHIPKVAPSPMITWIPQVIVPAPEAAPVPMVTPTLVVVSISEGVPITEVTSTLEVTSAPEIAPVAKVVPTPEVAPVPKITSAPIIEAAHAPIITPISQVTLAPIIACAPIVVPRPIIMSAPEVGPIPDIMPVHFIAPGPVAPIVMTASALTVIAPTPEVAPVPLIVPVPNVPNVTLPPMIIPTHEVAPVLAVVPVSVPEVMPTSAGRQIQNKVVVVPSTRELHKRPAPGNAPPTEDIPNNHVAKKRKSNKR